MSGGSLIGGLKSGAKMAKKGYEKLPTHTKTLLEKEQKNQQKQRSIQLLMQGFLLLPPILTLLLLG